MFSVSSMHRCLGFKPASTSARVTRATKAGWTMS
jgi:hypothetical protein